MVLGGSVFFNEETDSVELLDFSPGNNESRYLADLPEPMYGLVAGLVQDRVVACGGYGVSACYSYNSSQKGWQETASMGPFSQALFRPWTSAPGLFEFVLAPGVQGHAPGLQGHTFWFLSCPTVLWF